MDIRLIPKSAEWFDFYRGLGAELMNALDLNEEVFHSLVFALWEETTTRVGRAPLPLMADCIYIIAKLTGNRKSIRVMKNATEEVWGKRTDILPLDRRRQTRRWVWAKKDFICSLLVLDDESWRDFVAEWTDGETEKVVADSYWEESE
jgi:hypothetical protein